MRKINNNEVSSVKQSELTYAKTIPYIKHYMPSAGMLMKNNTHYSTHMPAAAPKMLEACQVLYLTFVTLILL